MEKPNYASEYSKAYRQKFPEKTKANNRKFREQNPDYAKDYHREHRAAELLRSKIRYWNNHEKESLRKKKFRQQNPEVMQARNKEYRKNNPEVLRAKAQRRRAKLKQNQTFYISKKQLKSLYSSNCFYCADKAQTLDHVIPISKGGSHGVGNLVPACNHCNFSKAGRTIMEWRLWKLRLGL
jgi:5-methylcytosine-specific restriction endonuclease McrA